VAAKFLLPVVEVIIQNSVEVHNLLVRVSLLISSSCMSQFFFHVPDCHRPNPPDSRK
jgi:hypothetical protein